MQVDPIHVIKNPRHPNRDGGVCAASPRRGSRLENGLQGQVLKDRPAPGTSTTGGRQERCIEGDREIGSKSDEMSAE